MSELLWKLSPSIIESYFAFNGCIRSLVLHGLKNGDKAGFGFSNSSSKSISVAASAGNMWEQTVLNQLLALYPVNHVSNNTTSKLSDSETLGEITALTSAIYKPGGTLAERAYIYQPSLRISRQFLCNNMSSTTSVIDRFVDGDGRFRMDIDHPCYPDLIRADWNNAAQKYILSVVDIKLAKKPKTEHKVQICFYIRLLRAYLKEHGLDAKIGLADDVAYTFNFGNTEETSFATKEADNILLRLFDETIPKIVRQISSAKTDKEVFGKLDYCTGQKCEWCDNYEICIKHCEANNEEIRLLPYITKYAQEYLESLCDTSVLRSFSLTDIAALCSGSNSSVLSDSFFWKNFLPNYQSSINMLQQHAMTPLNLFDMKPTATIEMPETEAIRIVFTAQKDEGYDKCYAFGINASVHGNCPFGFGEIGLEEDLFLSGIEVNLCVTTHEVNIVITVKDMAKQENAEILFVKIFHSILAQIDNYNVAALANNKTNKNNKTPLLTLQTYVLDNYELQNVSEILFRLADTSSGKPVLQKNVFDILFLIQGDKLVESTQTQPEKVRDFPIIVLTSLINRLFVLPAYLAYNVTDVCNAFLNSSNPIESGVIAEVNNASFKHKLSNVFRNDVINEYWDTHNLALLRDIETYVSARLNLYKTVVEKIRACGHYGVGGVRAKIFLFIDEIKLNTPELGQLLYEARYEKALSAQSIIKTRCGDIDTLISEGKIAKLKCLSRTDGAKCVSFVFEVLNQDTFYRFDSFAFALCKDSKDNREIIPFFPDSTAKKIVKIKSGVIFNPNEIVFATGATPITVTVSVEEVPKKIDIKTDDICLLFEKFFDTNLWKNEMEIKKIDDDPVLTRFIDPFGGFYHPLSWLRIPSDEQIESDGKTNDEHTFSPSQIVAYKQFVGNNITLLLGPPGSGKTDFIARALLTLSATNYLVDPECGDKPLKVLITANSHAAIDNVLFSLTEKATKMPSVINAAFYKVDKFADDSVVSQNGVDIVECGELIDTMNRSDKAVFVGSTVWALAKAFNSKKQFDGFDVVVVDEASQLRLVDALIALSKISFSGRYLIVGDEEQLPAIIQGTYEKTENQAFILGSVFRYYRDCDRLRPSGCNSYLVSLEENFRMNNIISRYSAEQIYKPIYNANYCAPSFLPSIGTQKLDDVSIDNNLEKYLTTSRPNDPTKNALLLKILDPDYPLVLCCVQGKNPSEIKKNEIMWVNDIVKALENVFYYTHHIKNGENYDSQAFWGTNGYKGDFGIISPHHEHINRLKNTIVGSSSSLTAPFCDDINNLFIGTVDKLQGQERTSIVVSYGVTDIEQALSEGEFIYSLNRLNVAITRAKKKCIVFLTDAVTNYPIDALNSDNTDFIRGIDYVYNFKKFMTTPESDSICDSDSIANEIIVYRKGLK